MQQCSNATDAKHRRYWSPGQPLPRLIDDYHAVGQRGLFEFSAMGLKKLLNNLAGTLPKDNTTVRLCDNFPSTSQSRIWNKFVAYKKAGYMLPFHTRRTPYKIKLYHLDGYVVKEYTGARDKVEKELAILDRLLHANIVTYSFAVFDRNHAAIVMEYAGQDLREHRQEHPDHYDELTVRHLVFQLTSALLYCHQQGIIHRDVKPDNIGIHCRDNLVQLFDFGESTTLDDVHTLPDRALATSVGVAGTPLFMPPESLNYLTTPPGEDRPQLRDTLTTKLDIWGLGTVMYFLLAGRDIFEDSDNFELENMADLANASTGIELPEGTQASYAARDFLRRCLERDPDVRASSKELMEHPWLRGACHHQEVLAAQAAAAAAAASTSKRRTPAMVSVMVDGISSDGGSVVHTSSCSTSTSSAGCSSSSQHVVAEVAVAGGAVQQQKAKLGDQDEAQLQQALLQRPYSGLKQRSASLPTFEVLQAEHKLQKMERQRAMDSQQQHNQLKRQQRLQLKQAVSLPCPSALPALASSSASASASGDVTVNIRAVNPQVAAALSAAANRVNGCEGCWQPRGLLPLLGASTSSSGLQTPHHTWHPEGSAPATLVQLQQSGPQAQHRSRRQHRPAQQQQQQEGQQRPQVLPLTPATLARLNSLEKSYEEAVCEVHLRPTCSVASFSSM